MGPESELVNFRHKQICRGMLSAGRKKYAGGGDLCLLGKQICWTDAGKEKYGVGGGGCLLVEKYMLGRGNIWYTREINRSIL